LPGKGHQPDMPESQFRKIPVRSYAYDYAALVNAPGEGAHDTVPPGKYDTIVGVPFSNFYRMMHPVHGWWNKEPDPYFFKGMIDGDTAVMELDADVYQNFEKDIGKKRHAKSIDNSKPDQTGKEEFAEMKTACS